MRASAGILIETPGLYPRLDAEQDPRLCAKLYGVARVRAGIAEQSVVCRKHLPLPPKGVLCWEGFKVPDLEPIWRLVNLVLIAAIFLLGNRLPLDETTHRVLLTLDGKQGLKSEREAPLFFAQRMAEVPGLSQHAGDTQTARQTGPSTPGS